MVACPGHNHRPRRPTHASNAEKALAVATLMARAATAVAGVDREGRNVRPRIVLAGVEFDSEVAPAKVPAFTLWGDDDMALATDADPRSGAKRAGDSKTSAGVGRKND